jgi:hypothetical protein
MPKKQKTKAQRQRAIEQEEFDIMELNFAVRNGPNNEEQSYRMVELLLQGGVPVDGNHPVGTPSPLQTACYYGLFDIADLLIMNDADIDLLYPSGCSILFMAAGYSLPGKSNLELVTFLIECGADVSHRDSVGNTILHSAGEITFDLGIMEAILAAGADINAVSDTNETPLIIAAGASSLEFVDFFIKNNARTDAINDDGVTAHKLAHSILMAHLEDEDDDMDEEELDEWQTRLFYLFDIVRLFEVERKRREDLRLEEIRQTKCMAVMMGHHKRLGEGSIISILDPDVTQLILQWV